MGDEGRAPRLRAMAEPPLTERDLHRYIAPVVGPDDERVFTDSGIEVERVYEAGDLAPGLGDEVQAMKAGLLEVAHIVVVNKGDRESADATASPNPPGRSTSTYAVSTASTAKALPRRSSQFFTSGRT